MATRESTPDAERTAKRRRTSSGSASSATLDSGSPRPTTRRSARGADKAKGKSRAERLAGFDDDAPVEAPPDDGPDRAPPADAGPAQDDPEEDPCAICLAPIDNKTVVYPCHHGQFCWNCIRAWTDQSRKCPLCLGPIEHLIHNIRSEKDYSTYHLLPLHTLANPSSSSLPPLRSQRVAPTGSSSASLPRHALYGRSAQPTLDAPTPRERLEEIALERRRYVYREGLYAKHVASNRYTGFKPFSPQIFTLNQELKARVIKFIRRELQVFPAVDVSFLTTYLISIASQLDLRSPAALRLVSDFLSDSDAEHLVHEIVTFARSPFVSLEGYDRFIQYGRPAKRVENERDHEHETDRLVFEGPVRGDAPFEEGRDKKSEEPRFAKNMVRRKEEDEAEDQRRRRPTNDHSGRGLDQRPRSTSYSPPRRSPPRYRRDSIGQPSGGNRRSRGGFEREKEPDWRDRDERYTGSYYRHSDSRKDRSSRYQSGERDERRVKRNSTRRDRRDSLRDGGLQRDRYRRPSRSRSPEGGRSRERPGRRYSETARSKSPRPLSRRRSPSPSRSRSHSRSRPRLCSDTNAVEPASRRSRSPTPTRLDTRTERTPTPPPQPPTNDREYEDAISLSAPNLSPVPKTREAVADRGSKGGTGRFPRLQPEGGDQSRQSDPDQTTTPFKPTLAIFGAARRLLGNGNIVTFSNEGKVELQVAESSPTTTSVDGDSSKEKGKKKAVELEAGSHDGKPKETRILEDRYQPVAAPPSLLSRLGPALAPSSPPETQKVDSLNSLLAQSTGSTTAASLKAKLQERLMAEYRQALFQLSSAASTTATDAPTFADAHRKIANAGSAEGGGGGNKVDLRALLQSRLQAEKAIAYDSHQRHSAAAKSTSAHGLLTTSYPSDPTVVGPYGSSPFKTTTTTTTFSQATKDLLLMRLEEERLLLAREQTDTLSSSDSTSFTYSLPLSVETTTLAPAPPRPLSSSSLTSTSAVPTATTFVPNASDESSLKAKLLEKRKLAVEQELERRSGQLKEKLMRDKLLKRRFKDKDNKE